ncbi:MAG: four helix bundle protein [Deltaproteobacteria bacterium]|nr:four helix bundle protein [Deltaproteobacteria bacterium]MBS2020163.1 four helix bundle protein [Deltaproteobacteria bacterium]
MLKIVDVILEVIDLVRPLVELIGRHDREHAKQIRDALNSALLNATEGGPQEGARRLNHYRIALGSSRESLIGLQGAVRWRFLPPLSAELLDKYDRVHATLYKCAHPRR